jgi:hypothetical protein
MPLHGWGLLREEEEEDEEEVIRSEGVWLVADGTISKQ